MINQLHVETLFHVIDQSANRFAQLGDHNYLDGILFACENIVSDQVPEEMEPTDKEFILKLMQSIRAIQFQKEEIRKAYQLSVLKAMKQLSIPNENMTPDTIGIFIAFLIEKFFPDNEKLTIFDPLCGTGNLLVTVADNISKKAQLVGVDNNYDLYRCASALFDMTEYGDELFYQDTLAFSGLSASLIVTDFPATRIEEEEYFPYKVIVHHKDNLAPSGMVFAIVENEFFQDSEKRNFKNDILAGYHVIGLIQLPRDIFRTHAKSILILRKKEEGDEQIQKALLVDIPSFEDRDEMQKIIIKINQWFKTTEL